MMLFIFIESLPLSFSIEMFMTFTLFLSSFRLSNPEVSWRWKASLVLYAILPVCSTSTFGFRGQEHSLSHRLYQFEKKAGVVDPKITIGQGSSTGNSIGQGRSFDWISCHCRLLGRSISTESFERKGSIAARTWSNFDRKIQRSHWALLQVGVPSSWNWNVS